MTLSTLALSSKSHHLIMISYLVICLIRSLLSMKARYLTKACFLRYKLVGRIADLVNLFLHNQPPLIFHIALEGSYKKSLLAVGVRSIILVV